MAAPAVMDTRPLTREKAEQEMQNARGSRRHRKQKHENRSQCQKKKTIHTIKAERSRLMTANLVPHDSELVELQSEVDTGTAA